MFLTEEIWKAYAFAWYKLKGNSLEIIRPRGEDNSLPNKTESKHLILCAFYIMYFFATFVHNKMWKYSGYIQ